MNTTTATITAGTWTLGHGSMTLTATAGETVKVHTITADGRLARVSKLGQCGFIPVTAIKGI